MGAPGEFTVTVQTKDSEHLIGSPITITAIEAEQEADAKNSSIEVSRNTVFEGQGVTINIKPKDNKEKPVKVTYLPGLTIKINRPDNSSETIP